MKHNKEALKLFPKLIEAFKNDNVDLFKENLPAFKKEMESVIGAPLNDKECVIIISKIVNSIPQEQEKSLKSINNDFDRG